MPDRFKLLIIDDEEVVLDSCMEILSGSDYEVTTASDGLQGLKLVESFKPDVVFVDLKMPGLSGFEVLELIRASDTSIVPIVITGYATVSSAVEAMKKGAYDFIPKPFTPDQFRLVVQRGVEKRKLIMETMALRREKEMLREQFAAIVSHELKSPLGAIQQNLFALAAELADRLTQEQQNRLERMKSRIEDLMKLIHTWLRVLSVDIERIKETFLPVSVATVVEKSVETVQPHAVRKDVEVAAEVEDDLRRVLGDEGTLVEAVVNLAGNAVKYSHAGGKVTVWAKNENSQVLMGVSDTGIGIPPDELPFVFQEFFSGKPTREGERGCGLGLAITRRIVEAHDGTLTVDSELGMGSTFVISLPALES